MFYSVSYSFHPSFIPVVCARLRFDSRLVLTECPSFPTDPYERDRRERWERREERERQLRAQREEERQLRDKADDRGDRGGGDRGGGREGGGREHVREQKDRVKEVEAIKVCDGDSYSVSVRLVFYS